MGEGETPPNVVSSIKGNDEPALNVGPKLIDPIDKYSALIVRVSIFIIDNNF